MGPPIGYIVHIAHSDQEQIWTVFAISVCPIVDTITMARQNREKLIHENFSSSFGNMDKTKQHCHKGM